MSEAKWPQSHEPRPVSGSLDSERAADSHITASLRFAANPDPLLDLRAHDHRLNLYKPGSLLATTTSHIFGSHSIPQLPWWHAKESRHEQSRSWRDHPSNFNKQ